MTEDNILNKSNINLKAAEYIIKNTDCYCSSVHCSYYSAFQYIKHFIYAVHKINYGEQEELYREYCRTRKKNDYFMGSHEFLITKCKDLIGVKDKTKSLIFYTNICKLKNYRHISDYKNSLVGEHKAKDSLTQAKATIELIKNLQE